MTTGKHKEIKGAAANNKTNLKKIKVIRLLSWLYRQVTKFFKQKSSSFKELQETQNGNTYIWLEGV